MPLQEMAGRDNGLPFPQEMRAAASCALPPVHMDVLYWVTHKGQVVSRLILLYSNNVEIAVSAYAS